MSNQIQSDNPEPGVGRASAMLMPNRYKPYPVEVPRKMPNITILIHGVNDVGVSYGAQDAGLCAGLNDRLNRPDLFPNDFRLPKDGDKVREDPDALYYRLLKNDRTYSPVIPFHWGYKATKEEVGKKKINEEVVDVHGNRLDKQHSRAGGMFANATSNIPDMFKGSFRGGLLALLSNQAADDIHIIKQAPERRYMVLAAKRLAALIRQIRILEPNACVNVVAHSQGCLISLTAQAFLHEEAQRGIDCLIMNHPPYGVEEVAMESLMRGIDEQQTTQARVATLAALVKLITDNPNTEPPFDQVGQLGRAGRDWTPQRGCRVSADAADTSTDYSHFFDERDNRGKVYLYFCPHDLTVGLRHVQGIGSLGVPDTVEAPIKGKWSTPLPVREALGPRFMQRVWTWRQRGEGKVPIAVGDAPGELALRLSGESRHGGGLSEFISRASTDPGETRMITGEPLTPPFVPKLHHSEVRSERATKKRNKKGDAYIGELRMDPIDACDAVVKGGLGKAPDPSAARQHYQDKGTVENSYHSSIVGDPDHSRWVTAMDVAVGPANAIDDPEWRQLLCAIADWRSGFKKRDLRRLAKYAELDPTVKQLVEANALYYKRGIFPSDLVPDTPPAPIVSQTRLQRDGPSVLPKTS